MTQPTAISLVVIHRRADRLGDLIRSVLPHIDELVLVDTGPDDPRPDGEREAFALLCRRAAEAVPLVTAEYRCPEEWEFDGRGYIGDFGLARTFAHGLASHPWHLTLDADDVFAWPREHMRLGQWLDQLLEAHPDVNGVAANYDYSSNVCQRKVRLFRADSWRWEGRLHEELVPSGEPVPVPHVGRQDFYVQHRGDFDASAARNAALLERLARQGQLERPQECLAWAAALLMRGDGLGAASMASAAAVRTENAELAEWAKIVSAIGLEKAGDAAGAAQRLGDVLAANPHKRIAWLLLAKLWEKSGDDEQAQQLYNASNLARDRSVGDIVDLPEIEKWAPEFFARVEGDFIRRGSRPAKVSSEEALHILCPSPITGTWGPQAHFERALGGSEQAVIHLAPHLARLGPTVVWASPIRDVDVHDAVRWESLEGFRPENTRGPVVVWRAPTLLPMIKSAAPERRVAFWSHDVPRRKDRQHYLRADTILVLSAFHARCFVEIGVPAEKLRRIRNGIDVEQLRRPCFEAFSGERDPHACVYASSANRGLLFLLAAWRDVRRAVPDATLHVAYDVQHLTKLTASLRNKRLGRLVLDQCRELRGEGVTFHGGLTYPELLRLEARCGVWAYPTLFPEVSCITAMETQALGLQPVTTDAGALVETVLEGPLLSAEDLLAGFDPDDYCDYYHAFPARTAVETLKQSGELYAPLDCPPRFLAALIAALHDPMSDAERAKLSNLALSSYDWSNVAAPFIAAVEGEGEKWPPSPTPEAGAPESPPSP